MSEAPSTVRYETLKFAIYVGNPDTVDQDAFEDAVGSAIEAAEKVLRECLPGYEVRAEYD